METVQELQTKVQIQSSESLKLDRRLSDTNRRLNNTLRCWFLVIQTEIDTTADIGLNPPPPFRICDK